MFGWLRRRRLSEAGRRRVLVALARGEQSLLDTHVDNALRLVEAVGEELPLDRAIALYLEAMAPEEAQAEAIARRVLARLEMDEEPEPVRKKRRRRR